MIERRQLSGDSRIAEYPDVNGGYPVIARTRIAVRLVVQAFQELGGLDEVAEALPQLQRAQVLAALDHYQQCPQRVDEDIARNARAIAALRSR